MNQTPEPQVFVDATSIDVRLKASFDLSVKELHDVAHAVYGGFVQVSSLHPKGFNGTNGWAQGTSQLRTILIPKGWQPDDPQGQPRIVSQARRLGITVSSGSPDTGVPNRIPQTRNNKGEQTTSSVQYNARQGVLFPRASADARPPEVQNGSRALLWVFLYYIDLDGGEMRIELSQPTGMSEAKKINGWSVRYILPPMPLDGTEAVLPSDDAPDIDFDVTPKAL